MRVNALSLTDESLADRRRWHTLAAIVVGTWIVIGAAVAVAYGFGAPLVTWWDVIHPFTVGALTTAIVVYSTHFVEALTRTGASGYRGVAVRVGLVQLGMVVLVVSRPGISWSWLSDVGAVVILAVMVWQILLTFQRLRKSLAGQFAVTVPYYMVAAGFLILAIIYAIVAGHRVLDYDALIAAHSRATVWGFAYLTVLGTVVTLLPTLSGTPIAQAARTRATTGLVVHGIALLAATGLEAAGFPRIAGIAMIGVVIGAILITQPVLNGVLTGSANWTAATIHVTAGLTWLIALAAADATLTIAGFPPRQVTATLAPALIGAGLVQLVTGVLHHLLPTLIGGGPQAVTAARTAANYAGPARLTLLNLGAVVAFVHPIGALVMAAGIAWTIAVIIRTVRIQYRVKGNA